MSVIIPRTVRLLEPQNDERFGREGLSLADFRSERSYVLLGEPGMGKSTSFREEAREVSAVAPIPARRLINGQPVSQSDLQKGPLFIDGLDEVRAGHMDPRGPLDKIVAQLRELGNPRFRLSCRSGSWLGSGDREELSIVADTESVLILQLNPLSHSDVEHLVAQQNDDTREFMRRATENRLDAFLSNPQLLSVLLKSVNIDGWPDSPKAAFESACRDLLKERNPEHQDARIGNVRPSQSEILSTVGKLFALMLIADKGGWSNTDTDDPDILSLNEVEDNNSEALRAALNSGLFRGGARFREPMHRLFAEFLGAQFINDRIQSSSAVSAGRALSLLFGHDATPLPDLRGLSGWLASFNQEARQILIRIDPVGVAVYGDARSFTFEELERLFENLENRSEETQSLLSHRAFDALADSQRMRLIRKFANSAVRSDARQYLLYSLLIGFAPSAHGGRSLKPSPAIAEQDQACTALQRIIQDATWRAMVRCQAIRVLDQVVSDELSRSDILGRLVKETIDGQIGDAKNELLGTLLDVLYPSDLDPEEIWKYLVVTPSWSPRVTFLKFWNNLAERSSDEQIRQLLDSLCTNASELIPQLVGHGQEEVVLKLLARGLDLFGDEMTVSEIYRWFELVEVDYERLSLIPAHQNHHSDYRFDDKDETSIWNWLRSRTSIQFELIELGLRARETELGKSHQNRPVGVKFLGKDPADRFRHLCLTHAARLWPKNVQIANEIASWAVRDPDSWGPPLSEDEIEQAVQDLPVLRDWNDRRIAGNKQYERDVAKWKKDNAEAVKSYRKRQQEELEVIRKHSPEVAAGRCPPEWLYRFAKNYFDGLAREGPSDSPISRLASRLDDQQDLVDAALTGFRSLLDRDDLPDLGQIAEIHESNRLSYFVLPFLAGMAEEERKSRDPLSPMGKVGRRRALAYYFVSRLPGKRNRLGSGMPFVPEDIRPAWFIRALDMHPHAVADALVAVHTAQVRKKSPPDMYLYEIVSEQEYGTVLKLAVKRMFTAFPTRCTKTQLESLRVILCGAMGQNGLSGAELRKLTVRRLRRRGMDLAQHAYWLCVGLFVAKEHCFTDLEEFLSKGRPVRAQHVVQFLTTVNNRLGDLHSLDKSKTEDLTRLLRMLGRHIGQLTLWEGARRIWGMRKAELEFKSLFSSWIGSLASRNDEKAAKAFESLASDPDLSAWRAEFKQYQQVQAQILREAKHKALSLDQIQGTLRGGPPANAADLSALVQDQLEKLAAGIRTGSTSDWRQYWHMDPKSRRPTKPQVENECRDRLLSDLRQSLIRFKLDARPEGVYADDYRADILVTAGPKLAIPIEIKLSKQEDVWTAVDNQLIPKYTRALESEGYGIYLVFWFGPEHVKGPPRPGIKPTDPTEFKGQLEEQLSAEAREKISIVVIDVSPSGRHKEEHAGSVA